MGNCGLEALRELGGRGASRGIPREAGRDERTDRLRYAVERRIQRLASGNEEHRRRRERITTREDLARDEPEREDIARAKRRSSALRGLRRHIQRSAYPRPRARERGGRRRATDVRRRRQRRRHLHRLLVAPSDAEI